MSDDPVRTFVESDYGRLQFQDYFVRRQCKPVVKALEFVGAETAKISPDVNELLSGSELQAVVICPSNPLISIAPILAVPGMRDAIAKCRAPVIAVSPIVAGRAIKGPTAKMLAELGFAATAETVGKRYDDILDAYIVEKDDLERCQAAGLACEVYSAQTIMQTLEDREALARTVLDVADRIRSRGATEVRALG